MPTHIVERFLAKLLKISEQSSPFRRWTTGSGAGSSYRHHDHRNMYNKQMSEGAAPVSSGSSTGSNVARWSLGLEHLLADPSGAAAFAHFLAKEFAAENISFWWSCEQYRCASEAPRRVQLAEEIWKRHLCESAPEPVNVDAAARRTTMLLLCQDPPPVDLFLQAQKQIFNVMKFDSYPRFLRSPVHAECARADLRGLPSPYAHNVPLPMGGNDSPTKLKKSASNASERRRSGGTSLLPWKRTASRERTNNPENSQPTITDVVKSSQSGPGQCTLCRVVLPNGATSVVGVEDATSVAKLVDRLLHKRNIICSTYDVLLKDDTQEDPRPIDIQSPSTVLGGREVVVERRAVVRIEVGGRWVAVRCRPQRRLRHVLRPVLARYEMNAKPLTHRAVLRDGVVLHPDTLMQELDGARLQIIEVSENGEYRTNDRTECRERDDDTDSLSDLAVRIQEDCKDAEQNGANLNTNGRVTNSKISSSTTSGTVRVALRAGPPLHHHPPEFLENLRDMQRQKLQNKVELSPCAEDAPVPLPLPPGPSSPSATNSPRSPPPLPPKPAPRPAPTAV